MSLEVTGSQSSRIRRPTSNKASLKRTSSSPFANHPRTKTSHKRMRDCVNEEQELDLQFDDIGRVVPLATNSPVNNVLAAIEYAICDMFDDIPERAGMNSTRISKVLNFRKSLPPVLSLAHIHSLVGVSTRAEREIASLNAMGQVRRIEVVGRGNDISGLGALLISRLKMIDLVEQTGISKALRSKWIQILDANPRAKSLPPDTISTVESAELIRNGLLVSPSAPTASSERYTSSFGKITLSMQVAGNTPSGSEGARGGSDAFSGLGGRRGYNSATMDHRSLAFSVPNLGVYLRFLTAARSHLLSLLGRSKDRMAPLYLLRERWDGAVEADNQVSNAKRIRGEFAGILPGQTKRWTHFYGLRFDWILQECVGAGLLELFETRSVGYGVRCL